MEIEVVAEQLWQSAEDGASISDVLGSGRSQDPMARERPTTRQGCRPLELPQTCTATLGFSPMASRASPAPVGR